MDKEVSALTGVKSLIWVYFNKTYQIYRQFCYYKKRINYPYLAQIVIK